MNGHVPSIWRPQLSVSGLCRLVGLVGVFLACLLPLKRTSPQTIELALFFELLITPVVLAIAVQFLVRRGVLRLWLSWFLSAIPFASVVGGIVLLAAGPVRFFLFYGRGEDVGSFLCGLLIYFAVASPFVILLVHLGTWLVPARCPQCARRRLFPDMRANNEHRLGPLTFGRCIACGTRFERWLQGPWQVVGPSAAAARAGREAQLTSVDEPGTQP